MGLGGNNGHISGMGGLEEMNSVHHWNNRLLVCKYINVICRDSATQEDYGSVDQRTCRVACRGSYM